MVALGQIGGPRALRALLAGIRDKDEDIRCAAAAALGRSAAESSSEPLVEALMDPKYSVRQSAASALGELGWKPSDQQQATRFAVATGAWNQAASMGSSAVEALIEALAHAPARVKAMETLVQIGSPAIGPLTDLLGHSSAAMRVCAAHTLGEIGDAVATEALKPAMDDPEESVRRAAVVALEGVGWNPDDGREEARVAMALEEWSRLPEIGPAAVPPLVERIDNEQRAPQILRALDRILRSAAAGQLSNEELERIASMAGRPTRPRGITGPAPEAGRQRHNEVARRQVGQLARAELHRRQLGFGPATSP
jgi:HEAT repeat protein